MCSLANITPSEYEFTLVFAPHRGYGRFVHVDAQLEEPSEVLRYEASQKNYPNDVAFDMYIQEQVDYAITSLSKSNFARILDAWKELASLTLCEIHSTKFHLGLGGTTLRLSVRDRGILTEFALRTLPADQTPFDRLVQALLYP
jgi:hypothetical protein